MRRWWSRHNHPQCRICGVPYDIEKEAQECASMGEPEKLLAVGCTYDLLLEGKPYRAKTLKTMVVMGSDGRHKRQYVLKLIAPQRHNWWVVLQDNIELN